MRILFVQFQPPGREPATVRFDARLGVLSALLRERGHQTSLVALSRYDPDDLRIKIAHHRPQMVYADIHAVAADLARRTIAAIAEKHYLPVVAGGYFPTVAPDRALSFPGVQAVVIGEADRAFPAYLDAQADLASGPVAGVWFNSDAGVVKSDLPELVTDLDALPWADRMLFGYQSHIDRTGEAEVAAVRGASHTCAYTINDWLMEIYEDRGPWVRRRSPGDVCDEIESLLATFGGVRRIRFDDEGFVEDPAWLAELADAYGQRVGLPMRCHVRANRLDAGRADSLAAAGCTWADIEVISGSDFIRNEIFDMDLSETQIVRTFGLLAERGIRTRAINFIGSPYETEVSVEETVWLNRRIRPPWVEARVYYPLPRTRAAELCSESGWISARGAECFEAGESILDMPSLPAARIRDLAERFCWDVAYPRCGRLMRWLARLRLIHRHRAGRLEGARHALGAAGGEGCP